MKKCFKRILVLTTILSLLVAFTACKKEDPDDGGNVGERVVDVAINDSFKEIAKGAPLYLTTVGQSDIQFAEIIIKTAGIAETEYTTKDLLTANDVISAENTTGKKPVVFVVTGTSNKGLTSSGSSAAKEKVRAVEFANAAEAGDIQLVVLHLGGKPRRGSATDPILAEIVPHANLVLVVAGEGDADGDYDGLFTNYAKNDNVPTYFYSSKSKVTMAIKTLYGIE